MRIKAILLTRSKKVKKINVNSELDFTYENCLYELDPSKVLNKMVQNRQGKWILKDQVAVYFEGNPTPIGYPDDSKNFREQVIVENALNQVAASKKRIPKRNAILIIVACIVVLGIVFFLTQFGGLDIIKKVIKF